MQKMLVQFEYEVNEKKFFFMSDPNAAIVEAKEALFLALKEIGLIEDQIKAQQEKAKLEAEEKVEEPKQEVA